MALTLLTFLPLFSLLLSSSTVAQQVAPRVVYANDFVDPDFILAGNFGAHTQRAQASIISWAEASALDGPWSVMNKTIDPPSGDRHDYLSWAPYTWPNCTGIPDADKLTDQQIWTTCPYITKDGQFNPDRLLVNDTGHFGAMAETVLYNTIAWTFNTSQKETYENTAGSTSAEATVDVPKTTYGTCQKGDAGTTLKDFLGLIIVRFLRTWFLDPETAMNPNLNYGQMIRGPNSTIGAHTGILDLKCMAKVASAILMLRKGGSKAWTTDLDEKMIAWSAKQANWLETAKIALQERATGNNHGTYYFNQLASLKLITNDVKGALDATYAYFDGMYMDQIAAGGEQPEEAARTHPYHYRNYNLVAMFVSARISAYASKSKDIYSKPTKQGATIHDAVNLAMAQSPSKTGEDKYLVEMYPNVASAASIYGDADGKYLAFMKNTFGPEFIAQPFILWSSPFASGEASGQVSSTASVGVPKPTTSTHISGGFRLTWSVAYTFFLTVFSCLSLCL